LPIENSNEEEFYTENIKSENSQDIIDEKSEGKKIYNNKKSNKVLYDETKTLEDLIFKKEMDIKKLEEDLEIKYFETLQT